MRFVLAVNSLTTASHSHFDSDCAAAEKVKAMDVVFTTIVTCYLFSGCQPDATADGSDALMATACSSVQTECLCRLVRLLLLSPAPPLPSSVMD